MVATAHQILHEDNIQARLMVEVEVDHNRHMVVVNIDGVCALRITGEPGVRVKFDDPATETEILTVFQRKEHAQR